MTLSVKMEPELRHVLAHMIYAIQALANGEPAEALFEVECIKGLVFWDSDEGQTADARAWFADNQPKGKADEKTDEEQQKLQGQELQDLPSEGRQGKTDHEQSIEELQRQIIEKLTKP